MAIVAASAVRTYLPALTGTGVDTTIEGIVAQVDAAMAAYLGFPPYDSSTDPTIEDQTYTLYLDGPGGRILRCPLRPIQSITSIYDDELMEYDSDTLVASTDYDGVSRLAEGLIVLDNDSTHGGWSTAPQAIELTVVAGWATIPDAIQMAAAQWAADIYKHRASVGESMAGGAALIGVGEMPLRIRELLDPYCCWTALLGGV